jgi:rhomboid protease GluP
MSWQQAIIDVVFGRQRTGSVICTSCGVLVGVNDAACYNCGRRNPGLWGFGTLLPVPGQRPRASCPFVIGTCAVLYVLTLISSGGAVGKRGLMSMLAPSTPALFLYGASGSLPVFGLGRWWTVLSAAWLHGSLLHILFNMMWVRDLAPGHRPALWPRSYGHHLHGLGHRRVRAQFLRRRVCSGASSSSGAPQFTVGASASIFGLLGALYYYGRRTGSSQVTSHATSFALSAALFGFLMPGIDNYAHWVASPAAT